MEGWYDWRLPSPSSLKQAFAWFWYRRRDGAVGWGNPTPIGLLAYTRAPRRAPLCVSGLGERKDQRDAPTKQTPHLWLPWAADPLCGKAHPPHDGLHDTWAQVCLNPAHRPRFAEGCARAGWASHCVVGSGCHPIPFRDRSLPLLHNGRQEGERPTRSTDPG